MEKIKECPFCGKEGLAHEIQKDHKSTIMWRVVCMGCLAGTTLGFDKKHAINLWNKRYEK